MGNKCGVLCGSNKRSSEKLYTCKGYELEGKDLTRIKQISMLSFGKLFNLIALETNNALNKKSKISNFEVVYLFSKEEEKQKCFGNYFSIEYENFFAKHTDISKSLKTTFDFKNVVFVANGFLGEIKNGKVKLETRFERVLYWLSEHGVYFKEIFLLNGNFSQFSRLWSKVSEKEKAQYIPELAFFPRDIISYSKSQQEEDSLQKGCIMVLSKEDFKESIKSDNQITYIVLSITTTIILLDVKEQDFSETKSILNNAFQFETCTAGALGSNHVITSAVKSGHHNVLIVYNDREILKSSFQSLSAIVKTQAKSTQTEALSYLNFMLGDQPKTTSQEPNPNKPSNQKKLDSTTKVAPEVTSKAESQRKSRPKTPVAVDPASKLTGRARDIFDKINDMHSAFKSNIQRTEETTNLIETLLKNLIECPPEEAHKYRKIRPIKDKFRRTVFSSSASKELMAIIGFSIFEGEFCVNPLPQSDLKYIRADLNLAMSVFKKKTVI